MTPKQRAASDTISLELSIHIILLIPGEMSIAKCASN